MDARGNMSGQHRRSKINHSIVVGPELTDQQRQVLKSGKKITKMTSDELQHWLEVCKANVVFWKNRRSVRKSWEEKVTVVEKEISKRESQSL